jgi:hypothetical protein|eukprot:COSAG01_NODE_6739_length_3521_cov_30.112800_5_plen_209_part_00
MPRDQNRLRITWRFDNILRSYDISIRTHPADPTGNMLKPWGLVLTADLLPLRRLAPPLPLGLLGLLRGHLRRLSLSAHALEQRVALDGRRRRRQPAARRRRRRRSLLVWLRARGTRHRRQQVDVRRVRRGPWRVWCHAVIVADTSGGAARSCSCLRLALVVAPAPAGGGRAACVPTVSVTTLSKPAQPFVWAASQPASHCMRLRRANN